MALTCPSCGNDQNFLVKTLQMHVVHQDQSRLEASEEGRPAVLEVQCDECETALNFDEIDEGIRRELLLTLGAYLIFKPDDGSGAPVACGDDRVPLTVAASPALAPMLTKAATAFDEGTDSWVDGRCTTTTIVSAEPNAFADTLRASLEAGGGANAPTAWVPDASIWREVLGVEPGAVTPFGIINDTEGRVTVVLDRAMMEHETLNYHPLINTMTTSIKRDDLVKFLESTGHIPRMEQVSGRASNLP